MFDPFELARLQITNDEAATTRFPALHAHKRSRLLLSPHAFLRGSAPLFYEMLKREPSLAEGPDGEGYLVGDMHLENVGAYRDEADEVRFGLNDFDDAAIGPLRLDLLRLATSVLLAGRTFQASGREGIALARGMLEAYASAWAGAKPPAEPDAVKELKRASEARSAKDLLDDRCPEKDKGATRKFERGPRYADLPGDVAKDVPAIYAAYCAALAERAPQGLGRAKILDAAHRIAGTGSLGVVRIAFVVRTEKEHDRIFDLKEARPASPAILLGDVGTFPTLASRVVTAARALNEKPARFLASVEAAGLSFVGRKLFPQEDKLDLSGFKPGAKLDGIVRYIGYVLGAAHQRGATKQPAAAWGASDLDAILDRAVRLAGLHEAIYLAYARVAPA